MQGIVLHCPNEECKKLLMKGVTLLPGSKFIVKCFWCGKMVSIERDVKRIILRDLEKENDH